MFQLAIECSGLHGSVALLSTSRTIRSISLSTDRSSVQSLAATVKALVNQHGRSPDFISVTQGPGSFTGLRIGLTTAKMLGLAWQIPLVAVNTLEVLALQILHRQLDDSPAIIVPVINAFRRQVFTAGWLSNPDRTIIPVLPTQVVDAHRWTVQPLGDHLPDQTPNPWTTISTEYSTAASKILVGGPGLLNYQPGQVCQGSGIAVQLVEGVLPEAGWVGQIGWNRYQAGQTESPMTLTANYVRASAAEDKLDK
jgi:tRNA threonylcarbamoyladenosine biosynthesis protein TsaB